MRIENLEPESLVQFQKPIWLYFIVEYCLWCHLEDGKLAYQVFPSWWKPGLILDKKRFKETGEIENFDPMFAIVVSLSGKRAARIWSHGPFAIGGGHFGFNPWKVELAKLGSSGIETRVSDESGDRVTLPIDAALGFLEAQNKEFPLFTGKFQASRQSWLAVVMETMRRIRESDKRGNAA